MLRYLPLDIIFFREKKQLSENLKLFAKAVCFSEFSKEIMSKDKSRSIFWSQIKAIVFSSNIFRNKRKFENLGMSRGYSSVLDGTYSVVRSEEKI